MFKIHILLTFLSVSENDDIDIKKIDLWVTEITNIIIRRANLKFVLSLQKMHVLVGSKYLRLLI